MAYASGVSMQQLRYCPKCGRNEDDGADFCPACGTKLVVNTERLCSRCSVKVTVGAQISDDQIVRCVNCEQEVREGLHRFRKVFLSCCADGVLNRKKWEILKKRTLQEKIDRKEALAYVRGDAIHFLERTLAFAAADGIITAEEEQFILDLRRILDIPKPLAKPILDRLAYQKQLTDIRAGNLPKLRADRDLGLLPGERCHLDVPATYHRVGSKSLTLIPGRLVATNRKLRFYLSDRVIEVEWTEVNDVQRRSQGIYLELNTKTGNGQYDVKDPVLVEAIIDTLVRIARRQQLLPEEVDSKLDAEIKKEVWERDRGKCVKCGSNSYLHFSEIVPSSRGMMPSITNLHLICAKCQAL
ncbi:MAG TPA: zinc ribbon domain-containing protein [Blastocatellia bacterium]|nr:zinc ribbon domain-containing protein [Blastocatellia bacterium]